jgi:hypothetical protein
MLRFGMQALSLSRLFQLSRTAYPWHPLRSVCHRSEFVQGTGFSRAVKAQQMMGLQPLQRTTSGAKAPRIWVRLRPD